MAVGWFRGPNLGDRGLPGPNLGDRGLFFGLMVGSLIIVGKMIKEWSSYTISLILISGMVGYLITSKTPFETPATPAYFFFSGMIAIIAMILPGISGSFLLLVMGKYSQVISAIHGISEGTFITSFFVLAPFACGCLAGLTVFSSLLHYLLRHFRCMTLSILLGLMIGSLHKLWPFRVLMLKMDEGLDSKVKIIQDAIDAPYFDDPSTWFAFGLMFIGFCLVLLLEKISTNEA